MSRLVEAKPAATRRSAAAAGGPGAVEQTLKDYGERLAKYVPAEVLTFYTTAVQLTLAKDGPEQAPFRLWVFGIVALLGLVGTPVWLGRYSGQPSEKRTNQVMGTIAFVAWMYSYPAGLFTELGFHDPVIAGLSLTFFIFLTAFVAPKPQ